MDGANVNFTQNAEDGMVTRFFFALWASVSLADRRGVAYLT
jgi:hypothetical protein